MHRLVIAATVLAVAVLGVAGILVFSYLRTPEAVSGPLEAIPLTVETQAPAAAPEAEPVTENGPTVVPDEAEGGVAVARDEAVAAGSEPVIFRIVQSESEARFIIDEVLNGQPKTVVGSTGQVAGEIAIDLQDPGNTRVGTILVNARALATDNNLRNRALKNRILYTDDYEYVSFTPTALMRLPDQVVVGESFAFQVAGDLTIRDVTRPVTFEATVTPLSETRLEGTATTTVRYADFGLAIPEVPSVTGVADEVTLELDLVATSG